MLKSWLARGLPVSIKLAVPHQIYSLLTTEANAVAKPILTTDEERDVDARAMR